MLTSHWECLVVNKDLSTGNCNSHINYIIFWRGQTNTVCDGKTFRRLYFNQRRDPMEIIANSAKKGLAVSGKLIQRNGSLYQSFIIPYNE